VGARSQHDTDATCGANTYYARLTNNGKVSFEKELFHGVGRNAFYPDNDNGDVGKVLFAEGLPRDRWIGFQFLVSTLINNNVHLQLSLDYDGQWRKVLEYTDNGNWRVNSDDVKCDGYYPENKIIQSPGFVFIRNDGLGRAEYKNISIEELN
jgi:hypothetical protein